MGDGRIPPRRECDPNQAGNPYACSGAFVNQETLKVERCDTCRRFASDDEAAEFVRCLLVEANE